MSRKVCIIGLDCAPPDLVFEKWRKELPVLNGLMEKGIYGPLKSTDPPITIPAWTSMVTSKNPGKLGLYGFRNRQDYSYERMIFANSLLVKEDTLWDILARSAKKVTLIGIPQTYPPRPVNGHMITCFLTPDTKSRYTYPESLKEEIRSWVGEYIIDVDNYRTEEKGKLLAQIYEMTEKQFKVAEHLLTEKEWDFFMMVAMGIDRIHHGFWKFHDPGHIKFEPGSKYESAIHDYYIYVDQKVGDLLSHIDSETTVLVVSDHGAKAMVGGVCVNEWLMEKGYLHLKEKPAGVIPFGKAEVDWKKTVAWGEGGYYSRIFLNVRGREPEGTIDPSNYERVRDDLRKALEAITDGQGINIGTKVYKPEEIYSEVKRIPPDLIIYFGNLSWRSVGSIGLGSILTFENDTGPDDANHDTHGIFIMGGGNVKARGLRERLNLLDVAPTVLNLMGIEVPGDMEGRVIET
jgi:predicted AlkP superfamily phosphohydrolase/phosphomutase